MAHRSPWKLVLALLAALSLLLAACGDDDDTAAEAETTEPDDGSDDTGSDDTQDTGSDDTETGDDDPDLDGADLGECGFFVDFAAAFEDVDPTELFAPGGEADFGSFFGPIAEQFQNVADGAPDEIQDSFQVVADEFGAVAEQLDGVVLDLSDPQNVDPEALAALETMETSFDTPEFNAASDEIEAWMDANCSQFADAIELDTFGS